MTNILTPTIVADFRFKFWFKSDGGNNLYIDDININGGPVGISELFGNGHDLLVVPDPVVDAAQLVFTAERAGNVRIDVLDGLGRIVAEVHNGSLVPAISDYNYRWKHWARASTSYAWRKPLAPVPCVS